MSTLRTSALNSSGLNQKYTNLVQISNNPVLVIEVGRSLTKVGLAGEACPRKILPTPNFLNQANLGLEVINFDPVTESENDLHLPDEIKQFRQKLSEFLFEIFKFDVITSPQSHKIVILEDITTNRHNFEKIVNNLFVNLRVPAICPVNSYNMIQYATGCLGKSHLIVDLTGHECKIVPVMFGKYTNLKAVDFSGQNLKDKIVENLQIKYLGLNKHQAEDIVTKFCYVIPENKMAKILADDPNFLEKSMVSYRVSGLKSVKIKNADRDLFQYYFEAGENLAEKIVKAIETCPVDTRAELFEHITIIGGMSNLPGLKLALKEQLEKVLQAKNTKNETTFKLIQPRCNGNMAAWVGASLFASTKLNLDRHTLLRDAYIKVVYGDSEIVMNSKTGNLEIIDNFKPNEPIKFGNSDTKDLSEKEMAQLVSDKHDQEEEFYPGLSKILPNVYNQGLPFMKFEKSNCLTVHEVMDYKKSSKSGIYTSLNSRNLLAGAKPGATRESLTKTTSSISSSKLERQQILENLRNRALEGLNRKSVSGASSETRSRAYGATQEEKEKRKAELMKKLAANRKNSK